MLKKAKGDAFGKRNSTDSMENHPTGPRCMMWAGRRRNVRSPSAMSTRSAPPTVISISIAASGVLVTWLTIVRRVTIGISGGRENSVLMR